MKQRGFLFTAGVTSSQMRLSGERGGKTLQTWDTCVTAVICGEDPVQAQRTFEDWCQGPRDGDDPVQTDIRKIVAAELIDHVLTESGNRELSRRWMEPAANIETEAEPPAVPEDLGEGYWVDVNQMVPPESARLDLESVKRGLPEDIQAELNWSPEKTFLFLASSLSTPPALTEPHQFEEDFLESATQDENESGPVLDEWVTQLPEMREKEAVGLVEARNSVVAGWLWRKFAATAHLVSNEILVNPCCTIMPAKQ
jgi:hypothetical protein